MTFLRAAPAVLGMAFLAAAFSPRAKADEHDKKTTFTFSMPVEIPPVYVTGMRVLPAGTYVFKLVNSSSNRNIVQIFNADETQIYATILAIPNYRLQVKDRTVITFNEGIAGKPESLRAWFFPADNWGQEFVYPKARAAELAKVSNLPVPAQTTELTEVAQPEAPQIVAQLQQAPVVAIQPTGETVELAQVIQSPPPPEVTVVAAEPAPAQIAQATLPATASQLPLIALCGLLALGGALTIRSIRKGAL